MTYDELQALAVRVICAVCQKPYDMTHPQKVCRMCRYRSQPTTC